jgi:hypothetical protein
MSIWNEANRLLSGEQYERELWQSARASKNDPIAVQLSEENRALIMNFITGIPELFWTKEIQERNTNSYYRSYTIYLAPDKTTRLSFNRDKSYKNRPLPHNDQCYIMLKYGYDDNIILYRDGTLFDKRGKSVIPISNSVVISWAKKLLLEKEQIEKEREKKGYANIAVGT